MLKQKIKDHLVKLRDWRNWADYENDIHADEIRLPNVDDMLSDDYYYDVYKHIPDNKQCAEICAAHSSAVTIYKLGGD